MTYRGRVENGVVVLEAGASLREGMDVLVEPLAHAESQPVDEDSPEVRQLREGLLRFAGTIKGAPPDLARNHDHYLHGTPRK